MKVGKLAARLAKLDPEMEIVIGDNEGEDLSGEDSLGAPTLKVKWLSDGSLYDTKADAVENAETQSAMAPPRATEFAVPNSVKKVAVLSWKVG